MKPKFKSPASIASAIIFTLASGQTHAAQLYWDISVANNLTPGNGTWGTDAFWATSATPLLVAPGAWSDGNDALFQTAGTNTVAIALAGVSANSVTQTISATATTISNTGGGTLTITGSAGIVNTGNSALTINAPVNFNGTNTYTVQTNSTTTLGGAVSETGTATISKTGNSTLNLNAGNSFSGGLNITAGRVSVGASGNLGSNVNTNNIAVSAGANLSLGDSTNIGSNQTISISSASAALGGLAVGYTPGALPTLDTSGTNSDGGVFGINYTGTAGFTSLAALDTALNAGGGSGHWYLGSQLGGTYNGASLAAASDSIYRLGGGGGSITFNQTNVITGANDLQAGSSSTNGGGTVVLGAAQNFTGATTISGGTLKLGHASALGDATNHTSAITVNGSGIFDFAGFTPTYSTTPINLSSNANGFDVGAFSNSGGSVSYGGAITLGAQTRFGGTGAILLTGAITGGSFKMIKDSTGLLELQNSGTVTLGQLQGNRGTVQVDSGTTLNVTSIEIGTGGSVGAGLTLNGGNVTSAGQARFGQGTGTASGTLALNGGTLTVPALTKGSLTFTVNFDGGTLKAGAASTNFLTATTATVKNGGCIVDSNNFDITIPQALLHFTGATTDKLTKNGNGYLSLSGTNTYGGGTDVNLGGLTYLNTNAKSTTGTTTVASGATLGLGVGAAGFFSSVDVDSLFTGNLASVTNSATSNVGIDTTSASFAYLSAVGPTTRGLVKLGANTLTVSGANAYTGGTSATGGALILLGDQSAATGGISATGTVQTTVTIGSATQTSVTTAAVAAGKSMSFGNSGGFLFQILNVSGAGAFPTTVTNNGSMSLGRFGEVNINAYGNLIQNGDLTIQPAGGTYADFLLKANGTVTYGGVNPINITTSLGGLGNAWLSIAGNFTTAQGFNLNSNTVATYYPYLILTGGTGTLKLSTNIAQLVNTTGTGGVTGNLQLGTGGGTIDTNGFSTTIGVNIVDVAAQTGSLTKASGGKLTLSGTNTYSGTTTVSGGTLEVTGSLGTTGVTVQSGGTLAGSGPLGGSVTIQSAGHHALAVAATSGAQTPRVITGTLTLDPGNILDLSASSAPAPGTYVLATAMSIVGTPTTVNFSGLSGTVTVVGGTSLQLTVAASGYGSWIDTPAFGLTAGQKGATQDPENDGMSNLLEFVLNGNPSISDPSILPKLGVTTTNFEFTYQRRDDSVSPETTQTFQWGTTLVSWSGNIVVPATSGTVGVATVTVSPGTPSDSVTDTVKISIPKSEAGSTGKLFGRLQVVK